MSLRQTLFAALAKPPQLGLLIQHSESGVGSARQTLNLIIRVTSERRETPGKLCGEVTQNRSGSRRLALIPDRAFKFCTICVHKWFSYTARQQGATNANKHPQPSPERSLPPMPQNAGQRKFLEHSFVALIALAENERPRGGARGAKALTRAHKRGRALTSLGRVSRDRLATQRARRTE